MSNTEQTPLPPSLMSALAEVANIADKLAACACDRPAGNLLPAETAACIDNLDAVASALTWKDLEQAPAMLNAVARAYRQTFPSDSLGWEDAATLTNIAVLIQNELGTLEQISQWNERIEARNLAGLNVPPALPIVYNAWPDAPPRLTRLNSL